jgi:uncharacterized membrane protein YphA (DoxX/SURF4 family)
VAANTVGHGIRIITKSGVTLSIESIVAIFAVSVGFALLAGLLTPVVRATLALSYLMDAGLLLGETGVHLPSALLALNLSVLSLALALTGPGSFSVDARLFDRVEIIIPKCRRHPF